MAYTNDPSLVLLDLDTHNVNQLLLQPALNYENVAQNLLGVYRIEQGVKDKLQMTHLIKPKNSLQPKTNCNTWNPTVSFGLETRTLEVCDFEVNGEQCADEWDKGCARNLQAAGNLVNDMEASPELNAILMAQVMLLRQGLSDDFYKVAWFGDNTFGTVDYGFDIDLSAYSVEDRAKFITMMQHCNGWWYDIVTSAQDGKVKYVDTNDGTGSGNAINPANVIGFFQQMLISSSMELRYWNRNRPNSEWPIFMVQSGIYRAYIQYLQSLGELTATGLYINGAPVPGVLTWEGFPVIEIPEWDMFDNETGSLQLTGAYAGFSMNQRALFIAQENLVMGTDVIPFQGTNSGLQVQKSPLLKDKGKIWMLANFRFGMKYAHAKLLTVGYNSSNTYV